MSEEHISEEELEWLESIAKHCDCCPHCSDVPCAGVQAGGMCDDSLCLCGQDDDFVDDGDDEEDDWL